MLRPDELDVDPTISVLAGANQWIDLTLAASLALADHPFR